MAVRPQTQEQVREAIGLLTAAQWDAERGNGAMETMHSYMESSEATAEDLIRGLVIVCRAVMGGLATERGTTLSQVLRHTAEKVAGW